MKENTIEVKDLCKAYPQHALSAPVAGGGNWAQKWSQLKGVFRPQPFRTLDALKDINFTLQKGDVLGVIGRNGAGKSTLVKILAGIMQPTSGTVTYRGKAVSILELGVGFHPDLTGRENVFLNGMLLGVSRADMEKQFDDILSFSELGTAIDEPVKHYSSGMYLRLAFSIFAHFDSDILLLDEVMAVGDIAFRQKSHRRITEMANAGTTVVIVSHDPQQIQSLCNKCLWIDSGKTAAFGDPSEVMEAYIERSFPSVYDADSALHNGRYQVEWDAGFRIQDDIELRAFGYKPAGKPLGTEVTIEDDLEIIIELRKIGNDRMIELGISVLSVFGVWLLVDTFGAYSKYDGLVQRKGVYKAVCTIPAGRINEGVYQLGILVARETALIFSDQALTTLTIRYADEPGVKRHLASNSGSPIKPTGIWQIQQVG